MKTSGIKVLTIVSGLLFGNTLNAQKSSGLVTESFKVSGNCGMCKKTIESAAAIKGVKSAQWSETNKTLTVKYNRSKTSASEVLRKVAYAGYDNEKYLAPDAAYKSLHGCCQYDREVGKVSEAVSHASHQEVNGQQEYNIAQKKESGVNKVFDAYFATKDALVKSDAGAAASAANEMLTAINAVDMSALNVKEHDAYMRSLKDLKEQSKEIAGQKNIEKQRRTFSALSKTVFGAMKSINPGYEVYFDHCPMYNDGKGAYWLSKEKAIKNPYYGSKMMTCGSVSETLK